MKERIHISMPQTIKHYFVITGGLQQDVKMLLNYIYIYIYNIHAANTKEYLLNFALQD